MTLTEHEKFLFGEPLAFNPRKPTIIGKIVTRLKNDKPLICKIVTYALAFFASVILATSIIGIPVVYRLVREWHIQTYKKSFERKIQTLLPQIHQERSSVIANLGGNAFFETLPNLDLQNRTGNTGLIDFLEPKDLSHPIMKGLDNLKRPFIAIKIFDPFVNRQYVVSYFQRYIDKPFWTWAGPISPFNDIYALETLQVLQDIIYQRHPRFQIVTN